MTKPLRRRQLVNVGERNVHGLIAELVNAAPVITDGAWGTQLQQRRLETGACPDEWNLSHPERGRGRRPVLRRGREPGHPDQHLRGQPPHARPARPGRQGSRDQSRRRGDLPQGGRRSGPGVRLHGPQRRHAHDGPDHAGRGSRMPLPSRPRPLRTPGPTRSSWRPSPTRRRSCWPSRPLRADRPAGGRVHDVRLRQGPRPHADGHDSGAGRRQSSPKPGPT